MSVIMFKLPTISWRTGLKSLAQVPHFFSNGFLQQGGRDLLHCMFQLRNVWI